MIGMEEFSADVILHSLYGKEVDTAASRARWTHVLQSCFGRFSPDPELTCALFSSPGRTELGGNHTDHQLGKVLAASVNLDTLGAVIPRNDTQVSLVSEGHEEVHLDISDTVMRESERGTALALIRGIADWFVKRGTNLKGFQAYTISSVHKGSGLSSSAAIEILTASAWNTFSHAGCSPIELAQAGQYAENRYFGKPSGLMDQLACASAGIIAIDFENPTSPIVESVEADFQQLGWTLCVVHTGGDHADLTHEYASIPADMQQAAQCFGKEVCRGISADDLISRAAEVRERAGDRAWLRAFHAVLDSERTARQADALRKGDMHRYLEEVQASGMSSVISLQNIYPASHPITQGISVGLALTHHFLDTHRLTGAVRVHGGGFAGTVQAYIPNDHFSSYRTFMDQVFGPGSVTPLYIRTIPAGMVASASVRQWLG